MGPWRLGGLGLLKERCLHEEPCLLNPTHWYAEVRVASRAPNGAALQTAPPSPPSPAQRHADKIPPRARDDVRRGILNQNRLQLIITYFIFRLPVCTLRPTRAHPPASFRREKSFGAKCSTSHTHTHMCMHRASNMSSFTFLAIRKPGPGVCPSHM